MWSAYSPRQSADLVGLTESAVRGLVRAGVFGDRAADQVPTRIGFSELALLRSVRRWRDGGVPLRTIRRELAALRVRTGAETLAALKIRIHRGHLVVTDELGSWRADSGQQLFPFELEDSCSIGSEITRLPDKTERDAPTEASPSEWFDRALELEEIDTAEAIEAYRKVLTSRPDSVETLINLGRLHAESGAIREAATCFERALLINPDDATANYNLGVVAQDAGDDDRAVELYQVALQKDSTLAEAHYNLATIYDRTGDPRAAIRHINEYRKLIRE